VSDGVGGAEGLGGHRGKVLLGYPGRDGVAHPERRFYFQLARELGMTVGELSVRMSSAEMAEWMALYKIEASEREHSRQVAEQRSKRKR
jgi:hypothetical protein